VSHQGKTLQTRTGALRAGILVALAGLAAATGGCSNKSFIDPSIGWSGRWERTPVSMPILSRIAAIEDEAGEFVEFSDPQPGDLLPQPMQYRLGQGDILRVTLFDLIAANQSEQYEVEVDARGMIELPQLGRLYVGGQTTEEATETVKNAMRRLVGNPLASVVALQQRSLTFNLIGAVDKPGPYFVPRANYRLLEAISAGGRFDDTVEHIYVIRLVPLSDDFSGDVRPPSGTDGAAPAGPKPAEDPLKVIDDIIPPSSGGSPAIMWPAGQDQPAEMPSAPPPVVNLPDDAEPARAPVQPTTPDALGPTRWVFINGKWTQVATARRTGSENAAEDTLSPGDDLVTQRVIRVPVRELVAGRQSVNIVIRPGDVVRVPAPPVGTIYLSGQVARPGTYGLPSTGGLTLMRLIAAAGGYGSLAVPTRMDVTRVVGRDREATIMLDGAAIALRTQPDIYLRPNDHVNVGTTFWAYPLAILRNGLRANYGFGLVLDRNIANDIFGPPPVNQVGE